jgi:hypothetical protein
MYLTQVNTPTPPEFITTKNFAPARFSSISDILNVLVPNLMIGAGIIFFIMLIISGFWFMNSDGNAENLKKIKQLLVASIIGISIVFTSYLVIKLLGVLFGLQDLPF